MMPQLMTTIARRGRTIRISRPAWAGGGWGRALILRATQRVNNSAAALSGQPIDFVTGEVGSNTHRVAPPGSTVATAVALRGTTWYTYQGGGPADGALYSAVSAKPVSSMRAGHPAAAQRAAICATVAGSSTLRASPSNTTSNSLVATLKAQRGSRARFFAFRVWSPDSNQKVPSANSAPMPVTWGLPFGLIVVNQTV